MNISAFMIYWYLNSFEIRNIARSACDMALVHWVWIMQNFNFQNRTLVKPSIREKLSPLYMVLQKPRGKLA